jgi:hypothetical protein
MAKSLKNRVLHARTIEAEVANRKEQFGLPMQIAPPLGIEPEGT